MQQILAGKPRWIIQEQPWLLYFLSGRSEKSKFILIASYFTQPLSFSLSLTQTHSLFPLFLFISLLPFFSLSYVSLDFFFRTIISVIKLNMVTHHCVWDMRSLRGLPCHFEPHFRSTATYMIEVLLFLYLIEQVGFIELIQKTKNWMACLDFIFARCSYLNLKRLKGEWERHHEKN